MNFSGKKVAVLGFGLEGESIVKFLLNQDAEIYVFDEKEEKEFDKEKVDSYKNAGVKFTLHTIAELFSFDIVVRSPGVPLMKYEIETARAKGISVTSATKIFFDLCICPIIGVTGTKGKGTTSTLIYEILKAQGYDAYLGGNIGKPPLDFLDRLTPSSWVVLELSSFQLQDLTKSPHIAVVLMLTSEHLDYHKDVGEYIDAKRNIVRFQNMRDFAIINRDYPASNESDTLTEGKVYEVSRERGARQEGCFVEDGKIVVKVASSFVSSVGDSSLLSFGAQGPATTFPPTSARSSLEDSNELRAVGIPSTGTTPRSIEIINTKDILLPGKHNWENVCAAVMAATLAGVEKKNIVKVLKSFKGLEHRLELIATIKGVRYYDDSFSSTPETAQAAIEAFEDSLILILGGSSKKSDFTALGHLIDSKENIKAIIGIGKEWPQIKLKIKSSKFKIIENCSNMGEIVREAAKIAELGDIVLLSPACASFDMFKNYKDRGLQFKEEVMKLKESAAK